MKTKFVSLVFVLAAVACGAPDDQGSREQTLTTLSSEFPEVEAKLTEFYEDCIITRAFDTPDDIEAAKLSCVGPTVTQCEKLLRAEGLSRSRSRSACAAVTADAIDWILVNGNAIECDSGHCTITSR